MNCETIAMSVLVNAVFWLLVAGAFIAGFEGRGWWERRRIERQVSTIFPYTPPWERQKER